MGFLLEVLFILYNAFWWIVVIHLLLSVLISFNVINTHNDVVRTIWQGLDRLMQPIYRPIQRFMPDTRPLDLSPMVLLILLEIGWRGAVSLLT